MEGSGEGGWEGMLFRAAWVSGGIKKSIRRCRSEESQL